MLIDCIDSKFKEDSRLPTVKSFVSSEGRWAHDLRLLAAIEDSAASPQLLLVVLPEVLQLVAGLRPIALLALHEESRQQGCRPVLLQDDGNTATLLPGALHSRHSSACAVKSSRGALSKSADCTITQTHPAGTEWVPKRPHCPE